MTMTTKPPIKRWSFSLLRRFESCPYEVYLDRVEKSPKPDIPDDPDHPLIRGERLHKEAEAYIRGDGPLTRGLRKLKPRLEVLRAQYDEGRVEVERKWGFTREWEPVEWDHPDCWALIIPDSVLHTAPGVIELDDWKSGKSFGKEIAHTQQLQLYAIAAFMAYPQAKLVTVRIGYIDEGKEKKRRYTRDAVAQLMPRWEQRAKQLTGAIAFKPRPNRSNCRFCDFGPNNGTGACPYGVEMD